MKLRTRKINTAFLAGLYQGLAAPVMLFDAEEMQTDRRSDLEKMRSDLLKIRNDFNVAIQKAHKIQPAR